VLDSLPEENFDRIAQVASRQFKAPISIISLLDEERSWIKAAVGIGIAQTSRANGFSSVVIDQDSVLIVPDAQVDPRFDKNILVTGSTRLRFYAGAPIKSAEGHNIGVLSIGDITPRDTFSDSEQQLLLDLADIISGALEARVVAQRTLTDLEPHVDSALEQHRRFVESLRDGILSCDQNGVLSVMNSTARKMYGLESAPPTIYQLVGRMEMRQPDGVTPIEPESAPILRALRGEVVDQELIVSSGTDHACVVRINARPLLDRDGNGVGAVSAIEDITEARRMEEHLQQAQKMEAVGQLTSGLAHDFNNLLAVVMGNLQLIERVVKTDEKALRRTHAALDAVRRGAELTKRLLAFSRKQDLKPTPSDANALITGMADMLERTLGEWVNIAIMPAAENWTVTVDESQLESAVLNLCVNARDAMKGGGRLTVESQNMHIGPAHFADADDLPPGDYVRISVTDTGTGMSEDVVKRVFEPFFTTKDVGEGSGLGLSMVYGFIKQSGGHITVYSEIGYGTSIAMYLPRLQTEVSDPFEAETEIAAAVPEAIQAHRILVVEDNDAVRDVAVAMLEDMGYHVIEAQDGLSALEALKAENGKFDLMFTDIVMPGGMHGPALAKEARAVFPHLPILYTSGYAEAAVLREGDIGNSFELVSKPYRLEELEEKVRNALDQTP
ncbi:MAG: response regulator, partial [Alphaproteobacteria bacterium]|nr:response regulator [Alphaproteobacteria bacterium]